jgi:hypothetical protein
VIICAATVKINRMYQLLFFETTTGDAEDTLHRANLMYIVEHGFETNATAVQYIIQIKQ